MFDLTPTQQEIVNSSTKKVSWLFEVSGYYWSTKEVVWNSQNYSFKVLPDTFNGVRFNRAKSEVGIQSPSEIRFSVSNKDNSLTPSTFEGQSLLLRLVISGEEVKRITESGNTRITESGNTRVVEDAAFAWLFRVKSCEAEYQKLKFVCEDFVSRYLIGDYPNTKLVSSLSPSDDSDLDDNVCVPLPFGTCYIPLRSIYITDQRYYLLGPDNGTVTYTINKVRTPTKLGVTTPWTSTYFSFTQSTKTLGGEDWRVFQPIIADTTGDGNADAPGFWKEGNHYLDMPTEFSRSDTVSLTNPADVIEYVLKDMGIPASVIDTGVGSTFESAKSTYSTWGLTFNGAFYYKQDRQKVLSLLLNMCHSTLVVTDKVELHVLSKASQKTITKADVLRSRVRGEGSFRYSEITTKNSDSGYIAFQQSDEVRDSFVKVLVPAKSTTDNISNEVLPVPFITDSQDAKRAGTLYFFRKLLRKATIRFTGKGSLVVLQPDDFITINDADYGGSYLVLIDSLVIRRDLSVDLTCIRYSQSPDDWEDLIPATVSVASDDSVNVWTPVVSGPSSKNDEGKWVGNVMAGHLRVGTTSDYILIDGDNVQIKSGNYVSGFSGFFLSPDLLEVGNIAARGIIRMAVFQKDVASAIGGNFLVRPADVLSTDMSSLDTSTLTIEGNETFAVGDILRIKDGTDDEWLEVTDISSAPTYTVTRDKAGVYTADNNPAWKKGASIINYGQSGGGGIYFTSSESNAPYVSVFTHSGSPWSSLTTHLRIGNLNGFLGYSSDVYGIAIGDTDKYLKYDPTGGLELRGKVYIDATDGLEITGTGNVKILEGGDIVMTASDTNPSKIRFQGGDYEYGFGTAATGSVGLCFWPETANTGSFNIGYKIGPLQTSRFASMQFLASSFVKTQALYSSDTYSQIEVLKHILSTDGIIFTTSYAGTLGRFAMAEQVFMPYGTHKVLDMGTSDNSWDDVYADDFINVADFYYLDVFDDLSVIRQIKPSGRIDKRTGLPLIDDSSLPPWLLSRFKRDKVEYILGDNGLPTGKKVVKKKRGKVMYDPEGKPLLSLKACISLCWGAIRQLDRMVGSQEVKYK